MYNYFHTTNIENLNNIMKYGLQPIYGSNSSLIGDKRVGKVSYSSGIQATVNLFSVFERFYYYVKEGRINEESFKKNLSSEEYIAHEKSVREISQSSDFDDWIKNNIYLCFEENAISDRHDEKPEDSYTTQSISPEKLKICVIKRKDSNSFSAYTMKDIYCYLFAKNPELKETLGTWRYEKEICEYKNEKYYLEYLSIEEFLKDYLYVSEDKKSRYI